MSDSQPDSQQDAQDELSGLPIMPNMSVNAGRNSALEQGSNTPVGFKPSKAHPIPPIRCTGTVRNGPRAGLQCGKWSIEGATVCLVHGGRLPNVKEAAAKTVEAARLRLLGLADDAIDTLEELIAPGTADQVRLGAVKEILDRGGIFKNAPDATIEVQHTIAPSEVLAERLKGITERLQADNKEEDILDAEEFNDDSATDLPQDEA